MPRLNQHPEINWPPTFGGAYAAGQPLLTGLDGVLMRVDTIPAARGNPESLRLIAAHQGHEFTGVLTCRKPGLLPELRAKLIERIGTPIIELGDIDI